MILRERHPVLVPCLVVFMALASASVAGCGKDDGGTSSGDGDGDGTGGGEGDGDGDVGCPPYLADCSGVCVNTEHDPEHCGTCDNSCGDFLCSSGECVSECGTGTVACDGACVDLDLDPNHCGDCNTSCGSLFCVDGNCASSCDEGQSACDGICRDVDFDRDNCGSCGNECDPSEVCSEGNCGSFCSSQTIRCGDVCVDTDDNDDHCGECNKACKSTEECIEGACLIECGSNAERCGNECFDTSNDVTHCGGCSTSCNDGEACIEGECLLEKLVVTALDPPATFTPGGLLLKVNGTGLDNTVTVTIDGEPCSSPTPAPGGTQLTCLVAAHGEGVVDVLVKRGTDEVSLPGGFSYKAFTRMDIIAGTQNDQDEWTPGSALGTGDVAQVSASVNDFVVIDDKLYINDGLNYQVRVMDLSNLDLDNVQASEVVVAAFAGSGMQARKDALIASEVGFVQPEGMAVLGSHLYVADTDWVGSALGLSSVRRVDLLTGATSSPIFGGNSYSGMAVDPSGFVYAADCGGDNIQRIDPADAHSISPWVGLSGNGGDADAVGTAAKVNCPYGLAVDSEGDFLYFSDWNNNKIKRVEMATAQVTTLAGANTLGAVDANGTSARFRRPNKLSLGPEHLFIADMLNCTVRMMELAPPHAVTTLAGTAQTCVTSAGELDTATLASPVGVHYSPEYGVFVGTGGWGYYAPPATAGAAIQLIH